jgi:hypothetical protein
MSIGIAYNPCKNCKEMDKCSICELTYYRKGYIKSPTADVIADTVRKMQERLKAEMENIARMESCGEYYFLISKKFIDSVAKEMLEDST